MGEEEKAMSEEEILGFLQEQLEREKGISPSQVVLTARLEEDLLLDSLDLVEMVMKLEDRFSISIPDEAAGALKTVGDVVQFLSAAPAATP